MALGRDLPNNEYQAARNANTPSASNPFATETITSGLQTQINSLTPSNILISGAVVWSGSGFIYNVTALVYKIQGVTFTTAATSVTLAASDPSNPRIDVIYADNTGTVGVITGIPAVSPVKPTVDPLTQLELTFVTVPAGAVAPIVTTVLVYDENTGTPAEWNATSDDANVDLASLLDPYTGTKSINTVLPLGTNREIIFTPTAPYTVNGGTVNFRIKAKNIMSAPTGILYVGFFTAGVLVGNAVYIGGSNTTIYGFDPNNISSYQLVAIPISAFGVLPVTVGALRVFKLSGGSTANFFLDKVQVQEGIPTPPVPTAGHIILDETTIRPQRAKLAFQGAGVAATDDLINNQTIITIPGGGAGAQKKIDASYAYNLSVGGGTWNGVAVGATALVTLNDRTRLMSFAGVGAADGCYFNTILPSFYVAGSSILVDMVTTENAAGGNIKYVVGVNKPVAGAFSGAAGTQWLSIIHAASAGFVIDKLTLTFSGVGLLPGDPIGILIYRDPGDVLDTFTGDSYVNSISIEQV